MDNIKQTIEKIVRDTKAYNCLDCGKCSAVCPISLLNEKCLPRLTVARALYEEPKELLDDDFIWTCLNCSLCYERCELEVKFHEFVRDIRALARTTGREGVYAHGGLIQSFQTMMASGDIKQKRTDWVTDDLKVSEEGSVLYLAGDLPYYAVFFKDYHLDLLAIARSAVKILNSLGIEPMVLPNERTVGHDLLWTGNVEAFKKLVQLNTDAIKASGATTVVTSCPEDYHTLTVEYPKHVGKLKFKVLHITQLMAEKAEELKLKPIKARVTYQDPCRLGRLSGIYEEPRQVMNAVPGLELAEMGKNRKSAICCGTSGWMNCGTCSKQIQVNRLTEAKKTGADMLVTACPKCQIHFACALKDEDVPAEARIPMKDLAVLVAEQLEAVEKTDEKDVSGDAGLEASAG